MVAKRKALDAPHSSYALLGNVGFMECFIPDVSFDWWCISANRWGKLNVLGILNYGFDN